MIEFSRPGSWRWSACLPRQPSNLAIARVCALQTDTTPPYTPTVGVQLPKRAQ